MPSRKEIQWSQLRVGALVLVATAVLIGLILLMSSSGGGLFARKLLLRSYFENAAGLKDGAPGCLDQLIARHLAMRDQIHHGHKKLPVLGEE